VGKQYISHFCEMENSALIFEIALGLQKQKRDLEVIEISKTSLT